MAIHEVDLRIEQDGRVSMSLRSASNRAITVATFSGTVSPNGRIFLSSRTGRIIGTINAHGIISGTSQINGARGTLRARPFVFSPPICTCGEIITPIGSGTISGGDR